MEVLFEKELHLARSAAMHAGEFALGYQSRELKAESKPDLSPVTIADKETEKLLVKEISDAFPDDGFLGEEGTERKSKNGRRWILDPIDGTRDFLRGYDLWAVLIGLEVNGEVVAGVAHFPARKQMFSALKGRGAWLNEKPIRISEINHVSEALLCVNGLNSMVRQTFSGKIVDWMSQFWAVRSLGGALDAMMLCSGHAEVWIENTAKAWDLAALKIIAEESGARFLNFDGGSSIYGGNAMIFVPPLESAARELLDGSYTSGR
jgi:histidinol phosphatase-like enzyme (inositol monophosphatase family)